MNGISQDLDEWDGFGIGTRESLAGTGLESLPTRGERQIPHGEYQPDTGEAGALLDEAETQHFPGRGGGREDAGRADVLGVTTRVENLEDEVGPRREVVG